MRAVLRTLAQCHSQGILHRDIKPGEWVGGWGGVGCVVGAGVCVCVCGGGGGLPRLPPSGQHSWLPLRC